MTRETSLCCDAHDEPVMTPEKKFEIEFFNTSLNTALMLIKERF
jgi:hypothetical protein